MISRNILFIRTILFCVFLSMAGCTSMNRVAHEPNAKEPLSIADQIRDSNKINVGDKVSIVTKDGQHYSFKVVTLTPDIITGDSSSIKLDDISEIKSKEFSLAKTAALTGGIAATAIAITLLLFRASIISIM